MDKETRWMMGDEHVKGILEKISSLQLIDLEDYRLWDFLPNRGENPERWLLISTLNSENVDNIVTWINRILAKEGIDSKILLMWEDSERREQRIGPPRWAKVIITDNNSWVKTLWTRGKTLYFVSLEKDLYWEVGWDENRYVFYRVNLFNTPKSG